MGKSTELSDSELDRLEAFLSRVDGGKIPHPESLDGFFAALAVCPDLIMPSEYLPVIQSGQTEDGDLVFENMEEAQEFMKLIQKHWNHVNHQLSEGMVFLPLLLEDENGVALGNDWAQGFLTGTHMRREIWSDFLEDEEQASAMVPIMALAYEHDRDPEMQPFDAPVDTEHREKLIIGCAAGVMKMHEYFLAHRAIYEPETHTFVREGPKVGRNDPCPCGSGKKYKKCCGGGATLH